jgi:hypothetical protein
MGAKPATRSPQRATVARFAQVCGFLFVRFSRAITYT